MYEVLTRQTLAPPMGPALGWAWVVVCEGRGAVAAGWEHDQMEAMVAGQRAAWGWQQATMSGLAR